MKLSKFLFSSLLFSLLILTYSCNSIEPEPDQVGNSEVSVDYRDFDCDLNGGSECFDDSRKRPITLADYPSCEFIITFYFEICVPFNTNNGITVNVYDFKIEPVGCLEYIDDFMAAEANGTINEFNYNNNVQIWPQVNNFVIDLINEQNLVSPIAIIQYSVAQCNAICYQLVETKGGVVLVQHKVNCGSECCQRSTTYTANAQGGWTPSYTEWNYPVDYCELNQVVCPHPECLVTPCGGNCEELSGF